MPYRHTSGVPRAGLGAAISQVSLWRRMHFPWPCDFPYWVNMMYRTSLSPFHESVCFSQNIQPCTRQIPPLTPSDSFGDPMTHQFAFSISVPYDPYYLSQFLEGLFSLLPMPECWPAPSAMWPGNVLACQQLFLKDCHLATLDMPLTFKSCLKNQLQSITHVQIVL